MATLHTLTRVVFTTSLQRRLTALLLVTGLLAILLMGALGTYFAANTLEDQIGDRLDDIATTAAEKIDRMMFDRVNDIQTFATMSEARTLDPTRLTPVMNNLVRTYSPIYIVMVAVDRQGVIRAMNTADEFANMPNLVGRSVADKEWFRIWLDRPLPAGQSYVSDLYVEPLLLSSDPESGRVIALSYPIRDERGATIGVWSAFLDWNVIRTLATSTLDSPRASGARSLEITLINKDGVILSSPKRETILRDRILLSPEQRQAIWRRTMDQTFGRTWFDPARLAGAAAFHGYSHYRSLGWIAITTQQRDEALAPVMDLWKGTLWIGLIVAVGVITLGAVASRVITRPLLALKRAAVQVSRGDLRQRVPITGRDEIGQLGTAFNHMVAQLEDAQHTLESRIEERTQHLQATLDTLRTTLSERDLLSEQLRQSSVPLIPLLDRIAVLPIVGALDTDRLQRVQTCLLQGIEQERLRLVLLDITAVPVVDTQVALGLLRAAQAAQLLGCQVTLVGIRPEVAATIVQLGISLHGMATHATLQSGLVEALQQSRFIV